ncbi:MAG TPA: Mur ligase family protein [Candidatus Lumbricidophila sp.]|nr:Mur ligase family protein [Candidatus Lumbricidophila sp.]
MLIHTPAILLGRLARIAARIRKPGGGSAVPGLVVNKLAPGYLVSTLNSFPGGLVIVSGSSGKSTTTKMMVTILQAHGKRVFTNPSTANIAQGLTSALIERASLTGRIDADIAVLEMDEGHGARIAPQLSPGVVVLTNVMTDQIDRFHDSERVLEYLAKIATRSTGTVVLNHDDAMVTGLRERVHAAVADFGVSAEVLAAQPRGLGYAQTNPTRVSTGTIVTGITGRRASVNHQGQILEFQIPARGAHYAVDAAAAIAGAAAVLGAEFSPTVTVDALSAMKPVFGRGEVVEVAGQAVEFVLVQNPASFQLNIDALDPGLDCVLFAMGSDVRDPGYFWPVDARRLERVRLVTGSKAHEFALQLAYQGVSIDEVQPDIGTAIDAFLALPAPTVGVKTLVVTADPMRRIRHQLGLTE